MTHTTDETSQAPWTQGPYSIKRHGLSLQNCDSEPVQTPGCIQAHGALLVLHPLELTVLQASENCAEFFGHTPQALLGQPVALVVGAEHQAQLRTLMSHEALECNAVHAFTLPAAGERVALDACLHTIEGVAVLEFEPASRAPQAPPGAEPADVFTLVKSAVARLQQASGARDFCQRVTQEVRRITGLDRVMVYHFHADHHGEVYAESKREDLAPWLGLHYPEGDIPKPAREIFKRIAASGRCPTRPGHWWRYCRWPTR